MANICKNICLRYKLICKTSELYLNGTKRCSFCGINMKPEGLVCPCCKNALRTNPYRRNSKKKIKKYIE